MRLWSRRRPAREGLLSGMLRLLWHFTRMYFCKIEKQNCGALEGRSCQSGQMDVVKTENGTYLRGIRFIKADYTEQALVVVSAPSREARPSCMRSSVSSKRGSKRVTFDLAPEIVP